jgi:predicted HTH transcriptional regulator
MFKDRIEISSPGSFYQGKSINKTWKMEKSLFIGDYK